MPYSMFVFAMLVFAGFYVAAFVFRATLVVAFYVGAVTIPLHSH